MKVYVFVGAFCLVACAESGDPKLVSPGPSNEAGTCQDDDADGYGENCSRGGDCDDNDPRVHVGCFRCITPQDGCACDESSKPVSCYLTPTAEQDGTLMCHEGTRYCRSGQWSSCEGIVTYPKPAAADPQAIVNPDAGAAHCNDCAVNCYVIRDNLDPVDAGLDASSTNAQFADGGGLTLKYTIPDGGTAMESDAGTFDPSKCTLGTAPDQDCDGIPDTYDPYPTDKPFQTSNPAIYMNLKPGATGTGLIKLAFKLNSADVYLFIDQTASMAGEKDQLKANLISGDFINDANYECADYDYDKVPNNELKSQGIVGAIRCIIRDVNIGVGWFREIPFSPYGNDDNIPYRNLLDLSSNVSAINTAVGQLNTVGNIDWPETGLVALNSVVTGDGMYFGIHKPGLPTRTGCPAGTWGYPCFRDAAIPIVILFTDAQLHNGPSNNSYAYDTANLGYNAGTTTSLVPLSQANETYYTAHDLGDLSDRLISYSGRTTGMTSDTGFSANSCIQSTSTTSPDAFFKFSLSQARTITATTEGSDFDTTLALYSGIPTQLNTLASASTTNDSASNAYSFGNVYSRYVLTSGNSSTLLSDYSASDVGCSAASGAKDAAFTFTLSQPTRVALDTTSSSYATVLGLFNATPTASSFSAIGNTNDTFASAYAAGMLDGKSLQFSGSTSASGILATYKAAQLACPAASTPADSATDAVYSFSVANRTRVRVAAEESTAKVMLALTDNGADYLAVAASSNTNEAETTASNIGALENRSLQYTGNTGAMVANYSEQIVGCGANDASRDAVYKFTLGSNRTVQIDTLGSAMDTVLGLFSNAVTAGEKYVTLPNNTNETGLLAYTTNVSPYFISSVNGKRLILSGGNTSSMVADYGSAQIGCGVAATSPDAVVKFHLDSATRVRVDTTGTTWDTLISLHNGPLPDLITTAVSGNDSLASARAVALTANTTQNTSNQRFTGSTSAMAADVPVDDLNGSCTANSAARDVVFQLNVDAGSAGNYQIDTIGSGFDTVLGVYPGMVSVPAAPTPTPMGAAGDKLTTPPVAVGTLDGRWVSYTGTTAGLAGDSTAFTTCSATSGSRDAYYRFTLNSTRTVTIDTIGTSAFDTVIGLYNSSNVQLACDNDSGGSTTSRLIQTLNAGTYYVIIKGRGSPGSGAYTISFRDNVVAPNLVACDNDGGGSTTSKITTSLAAGTYYIVVKGRLSSSSGSYVLNVKQLDLVNAANRMTCNDDNGSVTSSLIETDLSAGDYYVVVKGKASSNKGAYTLQIQDITTPPASAEVACNNDISVTNNASRLSQALTAGTYYVVVKGSGTASGAYTLNIKDVAYAATTTLACDYNSGPSGTALIETDLDPGTYRVVVKGKTSTDKGAYKLTLRDLSALPTGRIKCDYNSGTGGKSHVEADLASGTYTVVLKSSSSTAGGAYNLYLRDMTNTTIGDMPITCDNDSGYGSTSAITTTLNPGTYYAGIKGYSSSNKGYYQLNIGGGTAGTGTFNPATWSQTLAALHKRSVRVMSVLSCHDDLVHGDLQGDCVQLRTQATALANATNALGKNLAPLVFDIDEDGSGLSSTVVQGVASLAKYLEMNVRAQVVFDPDPNPGFEISVKAIDEPGDGCSGLVGIEHQHCVPGASPRFDISFTNPASSPVQLNKNDPNGGYNFRAELIGDNTFIVDSVPIYIIPVAPMASDVIGTVAPSGSYWQDVASAGCTGNQRPDWHDLTWSAAVPQGTSLSFNVCAADKTTDLASCPIIPLCTISGGGACSSDADCTDGFCSAEKNCQTITAGSCSNDSQCGTGASCRSGKCTFTSQPIYVGSVLGGSNYAANLRMQIAMTANVPANTAPVMHDWSLTYLCNNML